MISLVDRFRRSFQPGTVVVNVGDLLARWSNDIFRRSAIIRSEYHPFEKLILSALSTLHRVVSPTATSPGGSAEMTPKRQSVAFFCNPNQDTVIECLPNCLKEGEKPKYGSVLTADYLANRYVTEENTFYLMGLS